MGRATVGMKNRRFGEISNMLDTLQMDPRVGKGLVPVQHSCYSQRIITGMSQCIVKGMEENDLSIASSLELYN